MKNLRKRCIDAFPDHFSLINAGSPIANLTWDSDLSTGKALEFLSMLLLMDVAKHMGVTVEIDSFYYDNPDFFYLRNEIPYHHGAQAGHEASILNEISLENRFIAAITPKARMEYRGAKFYVVREGIPFHLIAHLIDGNQIYRVRPDLAIVYGDIEVGNVKDGTITARHTTYSGAAKIQLGIKNSDIIPVINYVVTGHYDFNTAGIIECSISKTDKHANKQIKKYSLLFSNGNQKPEMLFINGSHEKSNYETVNIDLNKLITSLLSQDVKARIANYLQRCFLCVFEDSTK